MGHTTGMKLKSVKMRKLPHAERMSQGEHEAAYRGTHGKRLYLRHVLIRLFRIFPKSD